MLGFLGVIPQWPLDIDDPEHQAVLRSMMWFAVEELFEAVAEDNSGHEDEHKVELVDGLHFTLELLILCGIKPWTFEVVPRSRWRDFVEQLAGASHELKNKPWKKTLSKTNEVVFQCLLRHAFMSYWNYVSYFMKPEEILEIFQLKNKVVRERQASGY